MSDRYVAVIEGLSSMEQVRGLESDIQTAAFRAINDTAAWGRTQIQRKIESEINLPPGYLKPSTGRLTVTQKAQKSRLEAIVSARGRPTSLARFVVGNPSPGARGGVTVEVRKGVKKTMARGFVIRLRSGSELTETKFNLGLAIRLKPGERLDNKTDFVQMKNGLYLLYGPSVDQVFRARDGSGVAEDLSPDIADRLEDQFLRQVGLI